MRRRQGLAITFCVMIAAVAAAVPAPATARIDDTDKPVILLTGAEAGAPADCERVWSAFVRRLRDIRLTVEGEPATFGGKMITLTPYAADRGCDASLGLDADASLHDAARRLSDWLRDRYGRDDEAVDVVAQGTSGVLVRYALGAAAGKRSGQWPEPLLLEDVVTLGAPHAGALDLARACRRRACAQLDPGTPGGAEFLERLGRPEFSSPEGEDGTDWSVIGSAGDELVSADSAVAMGADHKTRYLSNELGHADLLRDTSGEHDASLAFSHGGRPEAVSNKGAHVVERVAWALALGTQQTDPLACAAQAGAFAPHPNPRIVITNTSPTDFTVVLKNHRDKSKYVPYDDNCAVAAFETLRKFKPGKPLYNPKGRQSGLRTYDRRDPKRGESGAIDAAQTDLRWNARKVAETALYIKDTIDSGLPIFAGVNEAGKEQDKRDCQPSSPGCNPNAFINEGVTDHFLIVSGYRAQRIGSAWRLTELYAIDNAAGDAAGGGTEEVRYPTFDVTTTAIRKPARTDHPVQAIDYEYQLTQVRVYKKDLKRVKQLRAWWK
jgi:hypothetical protein